MNRKISKLMNDLNPKLVKFPALLVGIALTVLFVLFICKIPVPDLLDMENLNKPFIIERLFIFNVSLISIFTLIGNTGCKQSPPML